MPILEQFDIEEFLGFMKRRKNIHIRMALEQIEMIFPASSKEYKKIRKIFLDTFNDYTRSNLSMIFGEDFEGKIED